MTKKTTNLLGIIITILAGTYFYITCCSECGMSSKKESDKEVMAPVADEAKAKAVGHIEHTGQRATNIELGEERVALAKGLDEPLAGNATEEVKDWNRRTILTLN